VLAYLESGRKSGDWALFPKAMVRGDVGFVKDWGAASLIDALHKLSHDLLALQTGSAPRFFDAKDLPSAPLVGKLTQWSRALALTMRTMDHPFNAGLMQEALVAQAQTALNSKH
jgi:DNA polymerase-3 subunit delta'